MFCVAEALCPTSLRSSGASRERYNLSGVTSPPGPSIPRQEPQWEARREMVGEHTSLGLGRSTGHRGGKERVYAVSTSFGDKYLVASLFLNISSKGGGDMK
ncbi:hypothetical protein E2C01_038483 [Portunus trituberculatus]|uniref:Uncharacterized protein n=1 Tax=Portunus trituberculatus TaxID=210409 RepID=A0A5B7FI41_PORTR|nr:hypothetical protein [Portunus trituberculatus]